MKVSTNWLSEWLDTGLDATAIAEKLTGLGLEVDDVSPVAASLDDIVVGQVLTVEPHPNADRLSLCAVDVGNGEPLRIVCGAANVKAGGRYPTALVGARLPGGLKIKRSKIRGEQSHGMLCSSFELALAETAEGIMELDEGLRVGEPIVTALNLDDSVIDVDLTPNRADCFSMLGIARDLSAGLGQALTPAPVLPVLPAAEEILPVEMEDGADCPRFAGRVVRDLNPAAETPDWLRDRLQRAGVRPIHPIVDVTNYVMLELGQPMHAYDLDQLQGGISVRRARAGESLTTLDGESLELDASLLVIADASGPVGLAGIMGGEATGVSEASRHVYLESAFFSPSVVAGRARRFGLHTDASMRFERGVDPSGQVRALERATALIQEIAGGRVGPVSEAVHAEHLPKREPVTLRASRLESLLGTVVPMADVKDIFERLGMQVKAVGEGWAVTPPAARFDIEQEVDLIEEVARIHGYDEIPESPTLIPMALGRVSEDQVPLSRVAVTLVERGYTEAVTWSFGEPELDALFAGGESGLPLANPISSALGVMRQSLWPGLSEAARSNLARQQPRVRLFETGVRFVRQDNECKEQLVIAGIAAGNLAPEQWDWPAGASDVFDIKADLAALFALTGGEAEFSMTAAEHPALRPGRSAKVLRGDQVVGWLGEMHPELVQRLEFAAAPVLFELEATPVLAASLPDYAAVSRFPRVRRDLAAVVAEEVPAGELLAAVREAAGPLLRDLNLFDIYAGDKVENGSKSVALGLILQDTSRTLTDADVDAVMRDVIGRLGRDFDATIRE